MPTLLDESAPEIVQEVAIEEFDLERLARISEMQPAAPPMPARRHFRLRRYLFLAVLSLVIVGGLATLGPGASAFADTYCTVAE